MQLFSLRGSGITLSLCNSAKISREEATGCPFTKRGIILRAQEDMASREGGTFQTDKHCEGIGQRAKMYSTSSRQNVQVTHRQGGSAVLAAFLSKPFFFPHHQPLFFSLSHTVLPFPPPYFPLQCPFSCCFLFPVSTFPHKLTLPCQSSSWKRHFSCCIHTPLLASVCHPLVLLLQEIWMCLGQGPPGAMFTQCLVQLGPCAC